MKSEEEECVRSGVFVVPYSVEEKRGGYKPQATSCGSEDSVGVDSKCRFLLEAKQQRPEVNRRKRV